MRLFILSSLAMMVMTPMPPALGAQRARARELGVKPGVFPTGKLNAITDVAGVLVGQTTVVEGSNIRTGVTAILPHGGNMFTDRVPAALHVGNGFGKITGVTQLRELGELETPILLTCTLCVWKAADAMVGWMLEQPAWRPCGRSTRWWRRRMMERSTTFAHDRSPRPTCARR